MPLEIVEQFINASLPSFQTRSLSGVAERTMHSRPHSRATQRDPLSQPYSRVTILRATLRHITFQSIKTFSVVTTTLQISYSGSSEWPPMLRLHFKATQWDSLSQPHCVAAERAPPPP